jgi:hypothetical protein
LKHISDARAKATAGAALCTGDSGSVSLPPSEHSQLFHQLQRNAGVALVEGGGQGADGSAAEQVQAGAIVVPATSASPILIWLAGFGGRVAPLLARRYRDISTLRKTC